MAVTTENTCKGRGRLAKWTVSAAVGAVVCLCLALPLQSVVHAALGNGKCSDCHTMHRSQQGMVLGEWGRAEPREALLVLDCIGCHTGVNTVGSMPFVLSTGAPIYGATGTEPSTNTLAGGSFYWVVQGGEDSKGHNIVGVAKPDATLTTPPGFDGSTQAYDGSQPGGGSWPVGQQVTCAGTYGCHGTHAQDLQTVAIEGGHHHGLSGAIDTAAAGAANGYRMLVGVLGYEDPEWELTPTESAHNQYRGVAQAVSQTLDKTTISALCARCHGQFHQQDVSGVWIAHPVDYDMAHTDIDSEYRQYGGGAHAYQPQVPLASNQVNAPLATVSFSGGDAIVSCISCHRAHGSPYDKLLRWDYQGSNGTGCVVCHTSKS